MNREKNKIFFFSQNEQRFRNKIQEEHCVKEKEQDIYKLNTVRCFESAH